MASDDNPWRTVAAVVIAVLGFACAVLAGVLFWWMWRCVHKLVRPPAASRLAALSCVFTIMHARVCDHGRRRRRGAAYKGPAEVPRDAASPKDQLALTIKPGEQLNNSNNAAAAGSAAAAATGSLITAAVGPGAAGGPDPATPAMAKMTAAAGVGKTTRELAAAAMVLLNDASGEQSRSSAGPGGGAQVNGPAHLLSSSLPGPGCAGGALRSGIGSLHMALFSFRMPRCCGGRCTRQAGPW